MKQLTMFTRISFITTAIVLCLQITPIVSTAGSDSTFKVTIDGETQVYSTPPVSINGSIFVPMRAIFEELGATVVWDSSTKMVTAIKGSTTIKLILNNKEVQINEDTVVLAEPVRLMNNQVLVPLRFVSEALGSLVNYDSNSKSISIQSNDQIEATNIEKDDVGEVDEATAPIEEPIPGAEGIDFDASKANVRILITEMYKKDPTTLTSEQQKNLDDALNGNQPLLIASLIDLYIKNDPTWTTNMVEYFFINYLSDSMQVLIDISYGIEIEEVSYAMNKIIFAYQTEESVDALGILLLEHPNSSVRYNLAYLLFKSNIRELSFAYLVQSLSTESDEKVLNNVISGVIKKAGTDSSYIDVLYTAYKAMNLELKEDFIYNLTIYYDIVPEYQAINDAWKVYLTNNSDTEAVEIMAALK